jgi:hypothetical protein
MKAIVCDKCGKVTLLADDGQIYCKENGVYYLVCGGNGDRIDLCKECAEEFTALVRNQK